MTYAIKNSFFNLGKLSFGHGYIRSQRITLQWCTKHNSGIGVLLCAKSKNDSSTIVCVNGKRVLSRFQFETGFRLILSIVIGGIITTSWCHDIKQWNRFLHCWPFVRGDHNSPVNGGFPPEAAAKQVLIFSLDSNNSGVVGDSRGHEANIISL